MLKLALPIKPPNCDDADINFYNMENVGFLFHLLNEIIYEVSLFKKYVFSTVN